MKFYGTLDSLLSYRPESASSYFEIQNNREGKERTGSIDSFLEKKIGGLTDILKQIERDIKSRNLLFQNLIHKIYRHYCYIKTKLFEMYIWPIGGNRAIETRRSSIEKQLDALKQEKRSEQVQCWQDIAQLEKEFRIWFKQYCDLVQRVKLVLRNQTEKIRVPRASSAVLPVGKPWSQ